MARLRNRVRVEAVDNVLDGVPADDALVEAKEAFLEELDFRLGGEASSRTKEGIRGREGRRGGETGIGERGGRVGGLGRVIEGAGFGEGIERRESREGTSGMRLNLRFVVLFDEQVCLEEALRLRLRERVD